MPPRPPPPGAGRSAAPARRAGDGRQPFEGTADRLPPRSTAAPRRGDGVLDADLGPASSRRRPRLLLVEETGTGKAGGRQTRTIADGDGLTPSAATALPTDAPRAPSRARRPGHRERPPAGPAPAPSLSLAAALACPPRRRPPTSLAHEPSRLARRPSSRPRRRAARLRGGCPRPPRAGPRARRRRRGARAADRPAALRDAEVALAAGRPDRALAYLETAAAGLRGARDAGSRPRSTRCSAALAALGDHDRALAEHRRAASIVPGRVSYLARLGPRLARPDADAPRPLREADGSAARRSRSPGPSASGRRDRGAMRCAPSVSRKAWGAEGERGHRAARRKRSSSPASSAGPTSSFRASLNLTTALALFGRRRRGDRGHADAIERARPAGSEALRQLAAREHRRGAVPRRALDRGTRHDPNRARVEPRCRRLRRCLDDRGDARGRDERRRARREPARLAAARDRPRAGPTARGARDPCRRVVRPVARRRRRRPARRGARLGPGPSRGGLGPRRAHGRDVPRGPGGGCSGRARPARAARGQRRPPARQAHPDGG